MPVNGVAVAEAAAGGVLLFAGYKGIRVGSAFQAVLSGQQPSPDASLAVSAGSSGTGTATTTAAGSGSIPSGDVAAAQAYAKSQMARFGWTDATDWDDLVKLWDRESGWSVTAENPSGAYGIPQSLPGSKMASAGADWKTNAVTQINWGLQYIHDTYGSPRLAWAHEQANGWY